MKILLHDYAGHPFPLQLARHLAGRGHAVRHVYSASYRTPHGTMSPGPDDADGLEIGSLRLSGVVDNYSLFKRRRQERDYGRLLAAEVDRHRPGVAISCNTPLLALGPFQRRSLSSGARFVYWLQDFHGVAATTLLGRRFPVLGAAVGAHLTRLERSMLRRSDRVLAISEDFLPVLRSWGVDPGKTEVIHNWAPVGELPLLPKDNPWSRAHGLADKTCLVYSGSLGMSHSPDVLVLLAEAFRDRPDVRVVVISEGRRAEELKRAKEGRGLSNLLTFDFQPFDSLASVLATSDVLLAVLDESATGYSVPSKVLTYLCAGKPLLASISLKNLAARVVIDHEAGLVVPPSDGPAFVAAAVRLLGDEPLRARLGRNARAYAEAAFDIEAITDRFERILIGPPGSDPRGAGHGP